MDGVYKTNWYTNSLLATNWTEVDDYALGTLSAGSHTIKIVTDATGVIPETNEGNNEYTKTITVTDRASAQKVLIEQVGFSEAMTKQELDRYMFNSPGQAGSYFYGYSRILELRMETELALGDRFDRQSFNNFLLDQGLLPPTLLGKAVREDYVPKVKGK